jgi:hypothetical protein
VGGIMNEKCIAKNLKGMQNNKYFGVDASMFNINQHHNIARQKL